MTEPQLAYESISYSAKDHVALVTLQRPERMNGWTPFMGEELRAAMARAEGDPVVRVVVLTGAGQAFCIGGDAALLEEMSGTGVLGTAPADPYADEIFGTGSGFYDYLHQMSKPVVAAINGPAAGVGLILACFCDIRIAAAGAKLTVAMTRLGLPAEQGLAWLLPRIVGVGRAAHLLLASPVVVAEECERIGLVHQVVDRESVLETALVYATDMASQMAPSSLRMMKRQLYGAFTEDLDTSIRVANKHVDAALQSPEYREGIGAFLERRPARFT